MIKLSIVGSVAERVKEPFLWWPCDYIECSRFNSHPRRRRCYVFG